MTQVSTPIRNRTGKLPWGRSTDQTVTTSNDFWVGDRLVRPSLGEIRLGPERVRIEPRSMEVLLALVAGAPEVVPKKELIDAVWGEAFVSDEVLTHAIWDLRRAFGDNASDPEFIQTIPKRGYRLIAPVEPVELPQRRASDRRPAAAPEAGSDRRFRPSLRLSFWGLTGALALAVIAWTVLDRTSAEAPPATVLLLLPAEAPPELADRARGLDRRLASSLHRLAHAELRQAEACQPATGAGRTFCLRPELTSITDAFEANVRLQDAATDRQLYVTPIQTLAGSADLARFSAQTVDLLDTFLEVVEDDRFFDPDFAPWIDTQRYDIRAIGDFLYGTEYVYRDETGGRHPMDAAIERDPAFIAPRVFRTPAIIQEADAETRAAHRLALEDLYAEGTDFEMAMIQWALALMDNDGAKQITELKSALRQNPENRPARLNLGHTHFGRGEYDLAWEATSHLIEGGWRYPPLYPLAALAALHRDRLADARWALERAAAIDPIDVNGLALLRLLAVYDGNDEQEARLMTQLERARQDGEQVDTKELAFAGERLAATAAAEGRQAIAARLRESAD